MTVMVDKFNTFLKNVPVYLFESLKLVYGDGSIFDLCANFIDG